MMKPKQFSNEFDVLCSREKHPWIGGVWGLQAAEALPKGFWVRATFIQP